MGVQQTLHDLSLRDVFRDTIDRDRHVLRKCHESRLSSGTRETYEHGWRDRGGAEQHGNI